MGYSVTKAAGIHLMKCLASTQGPKIRINAILPGLLLTEWVLSSSQELGSRADRNQGLNYSKERIDEMKEGAALKQEVRHPKRRLLQADGFTDAPRGLCRSFCYGSNQYF